VEGWKVGRLEGWKVEGLEGGKVEERPNSERRTPGCVVGRVARQVASLLLGSWLFCQGRAAVRCQCNVGARVSQPRRIRSAEATNPEGAVVRI
jgi:hypothetical protein